MSPRIFGAGLLFLLLGFGLVYHNSPLWQYQRMGRINSPSVDGWAVLLDMNDYPEGMTDLPTNYNDSQKWVQTLLELGWTLDHIHVVNGEVTKFVVETAIAFLQLHADGDDIVLFYIFAHGSWITSQIQWLDWFPTEWSRLSSQQKLLVISACSAESFILPMENDSSPHLHLAAAREGEFAWAGLPEENLPIIGEVFNHFLTSALLNSSADTNQDEDISVEEAYASALPQTMNYISNIVFPAYPDFATQCNDAPPHPVMDDSYEGQMSLRLDTNHSPNEIPPLLLLGWGIGISAVLTSLLFMGIFFVWIRRRKKS